MPITKITSVYSPWTDDLETYNPKSLTNFGFEVHFFLSFHGEEFGDRFALFVCTLEWVENRLNENGIISGANMLIVSKYNFEQISTYINDLVKNLMKTTFCRLLERFMVLPNGRAGTILSKKLCKEKSEIKWEKMMISRWAVVF